MAERLTKVVGEYTRSFASEDGKNYRVERQEMDPVIKHVDFLSEKVNTAPKSGNRNDMRYLGSIPLTVLTDWCKKTGIGLDVYARNSHGEKQAFIKYLQAEFPVFLAKKKKSSQIVVPR